MRMEMRMLAFILVLLAFATTAFPQAASQQEAFLKSARESAHRSGVGTKTIAKPDGPNLVLLNKDILVRIARADGTWGSAWLGKTDASIEGAGFALEWNGKLLGLESSAIETKPFTNQFGSGI